MRTMIWAFVLCLALPSGAAGLEVRAGAGVVSITPAEPMPLAGYYSTRLSQGVHDDLLAKALVIEAGGERAALVVCDLITMPRDVVVRARGLAAQRTGILADHIMISATHTHTGPVLDTGTSRAAVDSSGTDSVRAYTRDLAEKIAEAIEAAARHATPAHLSVAHEQEHNLAHNRRYFMNDDTVGWNPGKLNPKIVRPAGPVDSDVALVYFESQQTNALAAYVNYAMHPDTTGGLLISADYSYTLSRVLSAYKGSNFVTLFANGTCGNINHVDVAWRDPQKGVAEAARLGTILASDALRAFTHLEPVSAGPLRVRSEMVSLDLPAVTDADLARASNIVAQLDSKPAPKFLDQVFAFKVLDVNARQGRQHSVEVQVIALGDDLAWVSLPGEIFVELGLRIKAESPFKHTLIAELANGAIGYIPTSEAFDQGNYEPISARCAKGSGEKLRDTAIRLLKELKSK